MFIDSGQHVTSEIRSCRELDQSLRSTFSARYLHIWPNGDILEQ